MLIDYLGYHITLSFLRVDSNDELELEKKIVFERWRIGRGTSRTIRVGSAGTRSMGAVRTANRPETTALSVLLSCPMLSKTRIKKVNLFLFFLG